MSQAEWEQLASQISLTAAAGAAVLLFVGLLPARWIEWIEKLIRRISARRFLCFILIPALSLAANTAIALHNGIPTPKIHDEFSYLLAADTFAQGRLTNPSPVFPEHFETPQELMRPTRMSKYPPGQGVALMIGQLISGEPIIGAWISTALACVAIYWMLLAFVRLPWAFVGGVVAALHPQLLDWSQNYWGGSVAVLGGAILLGAWGRLMVRVSIGSSIWLGVGLLILANSRPYEGLILSAPLMIALLIQRQKSFVPLIMPCAMVLLIGAAWMGYYNFRITGHVLRMPFMEYAGQYDLYPKFWFQSRRPFPGYRNESQVWVHTVFEKGSYEQLRTVAGFAWISAIRAYQWLHQSLSLLVLAVPLAVVGFSIWRDVRIRWVLVALGVFLIGLWAENFVLPHYTAPALPVVLLVVMVGWQKLWQRGLATRRLFARVIGIGFIAGALFCSAHGISADSRIVDQQTLIRLEPPLQTGRHLVFVQYEPGYQFDNELVYNAADLEESRIIWARYFGPEEDAPVAAHFANRQVWILDAAKTLKLDVYPSQTPR